MSVTAAGFPDCLSRPQHDPDSNIGFRSASCSNAQPSRAPPCTLVSLISVIKHLWTAPRSPLWRNVRAHGSLPDTVQMIAWRWAGRRVAEVRQFAQRWKARRGEVDGDWAGRRSGSVQAKDGKRDQAGGWRLVRSGAQPRDYRRLLRVGIYTLPNPPSTTFQLLPPLPPCNTTPPTQHGELASIMRPECLSDYVFSWLYRSRLESTGTRTLG